MTSTAPTQPLRLSYEDNERVRRICIRVANHSRGGQDRNIRNRIFDVTGTLLRECHLRARPLNLDAMERASIEQVLSDLSLLRKNLNVGTGYFPPTIRLRFQQHNQEAA
ncbi:hypothetical protein [Acetobacter lovaniensis]|uniref:Uncharacterized protein n=1 Tax=Acetobacter lovaniensis TaxID=104100 RepID=A0A841QER9_9PROT|nr:hypothetical protein [Acetobacter lovaniensis]MBB6456950.1 hypothetical protein [Acetobacter lovaniensis]NHN81059.1 hypothetical protein [Acetobacter lovaniensis]GBQ69713.1 hypothetical protein AA0474_1997 [Acetobacter lovaniensis NRIC 0474]